MSPEEFVESTHGAIVPTSPASLCDHQNFCTTVVVNRITDHDPIRYMADVRVTCADCGQKFGFAGLPKRISTDLPGVSMTRLEAMLPIEPIDVKEELAGGGVCQVDMR